MKEERYILLYHGVTSTKPEGIENFSRKHICAAEFEKQMKFIRENMNPVTLRDINNKENLGELPVAITFDDTFQNVESVALPILKKYNIPATFFITSGFIDTDRIFWVDKIEHIINYSKRERFSIDFPHKKEFKIKSHDEKIQAVKDIKDIIKSHDQKIHDVVLESIERQLGIIDHSFVDNYKNLTSECVRRLDCPPMYEVGGHTVNHEILSQLKAEDLKFEVNECLKHLENITNRKIDLFSYPEGQSNHFNKNVISVLKDRGVKICPTAMTGFNKFETDAFKLKRIMVGFMGLKFPFEVINNEFFVRDIG